MKRTSHREEEEDSNQRISSTPVSNAPAQASKDRKSVHFAESIESSLDNEVNQEKKEKSHKKKKSRKQLRDSSKEHSSNMSDLRYIAEEVESKEKYLERDFMVAIDKKAAKKKGKWLSEFYI